LACWNFLVICGRRTNRHVLKMKFYVLAGLVLLACLWPVQAKNFCKDKEDGDYQNLYDCNTFFTCSNGITHLMPCPPYTWFNPKTGKCDYPKNVECKLDGGFTDWTEWGSCSTTCGEGIKTRSRTCTNPKPKNGGKDCEGPREESSVCQIKPCPVDGKWGPWSEFGDCSKSCGGGIQQRTRECTPPLHGGKPCEGEASESRACNTKRCPDKFCKGMQDGNYQNNHDCTSFYACVNGITRIMYCPDRLWYDPVNDRCEFPKNVVCPGEDVWTW